MIDFVQRIAPALICVIVTVIPSTSDASGMDDAERAKAALYQCVAHRIPFVDDGVTAPAQIGAAAAQLCQKEIDAAALALDQAVGAPAGEGVREAAQEGTVFATLVLMRRAALKQRQQ